MEATRKLEEKLNAKEENDKQNFKVANEQTGLTGFYSGLLYGSK